MRSMFWRMPSTLLASRSSTRSVSFLVGGDMAEGNGAVTSGSSSCCVSGPVAYHWKPEYAAWPGCRSRTDFSGSYTELAGSCSRYFRA